MPPPAPSPPAVEPNGGFSAYCDEFIHSWAKTLTALGIVLIPLFYVLDTFTMPSELLPRFAAVRTAATVIAVIEHIILRRTKPSRFSYLHGYFFGLMVGSMITVMTIDLGGFDSSYYAGLNLVIVGVNILLPWRAIHATVNGTVLVTMYVAANAVFGGPFQTANLINNVYFLGSTVVISVAISLLRYRLTAQEFSLREKLLETNQSLDRSRKELAAARDALWGEMEVAKRIQTALLPQNQGLGPYEIRAVMQPAAEVGGDYYDIIRTTAGEDWVTIGDVSGHGVESGLVMMMTQTSIATTVNAIPGLEPTDVFNTVNVVVCENISRLGAMHYMTLNILRLKPDRVTVAGKHQDFLVCRASNGEVDQISNDGCWLGVIADTRGGVENQDIPMAEGDLLLLYTDGITEARSAKGELFGEARLKATLKRVASRPLDEALRAILDEVTRFETRQEDDITLVLIRKSRA
ncbi:MAG: PP2C family protein-serine/threonine phosphatase [Myxococcales bacterium]|nr:PP2C family protein-serine/threonine phosphatase [Myxococcales bacterium]